RASRSSISTSATSSATSSFSKSSRRTKRSRTATGIIGRRPRAADGMTSSRVGVLRVHVSDERGRRIAAGGVGAWLARVAPARARGTVNVAVVPDRTVRALNRRYRRKNRPTDVLSFPAGHGEAAFLGDIVIAGGVAKAQARLAGHSVGIELRVLALHGLLHLLGYDHETDRGEMRRVEARLLGRAALTARQGRTVLDAREPYQAKRVGRGGGTARK